MGLRRRRHRRELRYPRELKNSRELRYGMAMAVLLSLLLSACGAGEPIETTLSALSRASGDFSQKHVRVSGTLRTFPDPRHYWIENDRLERVALEGDEDLEQALAHRVGQTIQVRGTFYYDSKKGRRIRVKELAAGSTQPGEG